MNSSSERKSAGPRATQGGSRALDPCPSLHTHSLSALRQVYGLCISLYCPCRKHVVSSGRACGGTNSGDGVLQASRAVTSKLTRFQSHLPGREPRLLTQPLSPWSFWQRGRHHLLAKQPSGPAQGHWQLHTLGIFAPASLGMCWLGASRLK